MRLPNWSTTRFLKSSYAVLLLFALINLIFFHQYFFNNLIPIPADILIGTYFPWLNEKWGYEVGVPVKNALMSDVVSLLYPWRKLAIDYFKSGQLPLWDPTSFLGTSLIGNFQAGIFNPFNLLFFLPFSFDRIWGFQVVIQPFLAMVSMYFLLKHWRLPKIAGIFGSLSYAFSAQLLVWIEYNVHGFIIAVFPLFILLIDKFLKAGKTIYIPIISLIIAYIIFIGYPQHLYYFVFFGFLYAGLNLIIDKQIRKILILLPALLISIMVGLGLSAVVLFPGIESLLYSIKNLDSVAFQNSVLYLPLENLLTAFVPDFFGNPATNNYFGKGYYESFIFYTGIVSLLLAFFSLLNKSRRIDTFIMFLFTSLSLLLSLNSPLSSLIQDLEWLGLKGSVGSRVLFIYGFSVSVLAAFGIEEILKPRFSKKHLLILLPFLVIPAIFLWIIISLNYPQLLPGNLEAFKNDPSKLITSFRNTLLPLGLSITAVLVVLSGIFLKNKNIIVVLLAVLLLIDGFRFGWKYLPFTSENLIFPETPIIEYLKSRKEPYRIVIERAEVLTANTWSVYGLESISGYNILLPRNTADYINFINAADFSGSYSRFLDINNFDSKLLDIANVEYVMVLLRKEGIPDGAGTPPHYLSEVKYEKVNQEKAVALYKNKNFLPRVYPIEKVLVEKNSLEAYKLIESEKFDYKNSVVLDTDLASGLTGGCQIDNLSVRAQVVTFNTNCPGNSLIALSQLYFPGWKASVNNDKVPLKKANGIFTAVEVSGGESKVKIKYFPDSFLMGIYMSLFSFLILVVLFALSYKTNFSLVKKYK